MLECPLTNPAFFSQLTGKQHEVQQGCMPPRGLLLPSGQTVHISLLVHTHQACSGALLSLALEWQEFVLVVLFPT